MSVGFSEALVAMLGGAAKEVNTDAASRRQAEQMREAARLKRQESSYSSSYDKFATAQAKIRSLQAADPWNNDLIAYKMLSERDYNDSVIKGLLSSGKHKEIWDAELKQYSSVKEPSAPDFEGEESKDSISFLRDRFGFNPTVRKDQLREKMSRMHSSYGRGVVTENNEKISQYVTAEPPASFIGMKKEIDKERESMSILFPEEDPINLEAKDDVVRLLATRRKLRDQLQKDPSNVSIREELSVIDDSIEKASTLTGQTEVDESIRFRLPRQVEQLHNTISSSRQVVQSVTNLKKHLVAQSQGIAGAAQSVASGVSNTLRGISELSGFLDPRSTDELAQELSEAGLSGEDIRAMDSGFLKGYAEGERIRLIYAVANTFKEEGRRDINKFDIQNATSLVGGGTSEITAGRLANLQEGVERKILEANRRGYLLEGVSSTEKAQFAQGYWNAAVARNPEAFVNADGTPKQRGKDYRIDETGTLYIRLAPHEQSALGLETDAITLEDFIARTEGV